MIGIRNICVCLRRICGDEDGLGAFWGLIHALGCTIASAGGSGVVENVGRISSRRLQGGQSVHKNQNIDL